MKKMMLALLILTALCEVSMAKDESQMTVVRHGDIIKVFYKSNGLSCVKVSIADESGTEIFKEELICNQGFIRPYNFAELPKGHYTIRIKDGSGQRSEKVNFIDQPWTTHIARLNTDENKVIVAIPHQGANDFTIQVLDRNDQVVYQEDHKTDADFAKVFNLSKLERGTTINLVNHITGEAKSVPTN